MTAEDYCNFLDRQGRKGFWHSVRSEARRKPLTCSPDMFLPSTPEYQARKRWLDKVRDVLKRDYPAGFDSFSESQYLTGYFRTAFDLLAHISLVQDPDTFKDYRSQFDLFT